MKRFTPASDILRSLVIPALIISAVSSGCQTTVSPAREAPPDDTSFFSDAPTRTIRKADLVHNGAQPEIEVDPQTYEVRADGELLTCEPAKELPLSQRYFLF